ncbi:MAG: glycosyltransferase, exosortase A system-associated [Gammaproteobacteria bacterium]|nr:glycosyltransferase, exosortase A system-associated [Gammaproteobacteria bacterium]
MKILHILDHSIPLHSGYTFRTRAILEQQHALGWETAQVTSSKHVAASPDEETVDGLHFYRTRPSGASLMKLPILDQLDVVISLNKRLDQVIAEENPDILHAHSPCLNGLAALRAGRRHAIPVVYECRAFWEDAAVDHGTCSEGSIKYRLTRGLETYVFKQADAVTTICDGLRNDIISRGVPEDRVTVIPNAVDIERFRLDEEVDQDLSAKLGLNGKSVLGFIGSFYAYEGLTMLVKALPQILSGAPDVCMLLVGGGPQEHEIKNLVSRMQLEDSVVFTGRVPHDEVNDYYNLVDIFVYPRLSMRLTELVTPLKPLEAMAQGKLVLASDVGGHKELIQDGWNGRMFSAGSSNSLADAVLDLIGNKEQWEALKTNGRLFVEQERNWLASVSRYYDVYNRLLPLVKNPNRRPE